MPITVNKKVVDFIENETIKLLLKRMHFTFPMIVVKADGELIRKTEYSKFIIKNNSKIDVIHLISGG